MTEESEYAPSFFYRKAEKTVPRDQINNLSYGTHPDGFINPNETSSALSEYQLKYCTFKLDHEKELEVSRFERIRVIDLMEKLSTVKQRSYTNPYDSMYPIIRSKSVEVPLDRSKEAEMKYFKMNGWTEYQASYDRYDYKEIV